MFKIRNEVGFLKIFFFKLCSVVAYSSCVIMTIVFNISLKYFEYFAFLNEMLYIAFNIP